MARPASNGMNKLLVSVLATTVVVGVVSFYGGMKYGQSTGNGSFTNLTPAERQARFGVNGGRTGGARGGAGGFTNGDIIAKDATSITVKMRDGSSKIIFYSDSTEVGKFVSGGSGDLEVGKSVSANGTADSDGSITAQSIQIRPPMPSPSASPSVSSNK